MALSFFFEYTPNSEKANSVPIQTASILPLSPAALTNNILPVASATLPDFKKTSAPTPSFRDSLFYNYYAQTLGVQFDYSENKQLIATVTDWIGTPYRSGAASKRGTDCSGFVSKVYKEAFGITLVHSSRSMFQSVERIKKTAIQAGDLVFFRRGPGKPIYHVGIYLNDSKFVHSASNGGVMVSSLKQGYYARNYYAAGRVNM
jgi:lipoprotein Spr/probable lipoprotein NlpC